MDNIVTAVGALFSWLTGTHVVVFPSLAVLVHTGVIIVLLFNRLRLALVREVDQKRVYVGLASSRILFDETTRSEAFWNPLGSNV